jgi:hypothetical protein
VYKSQRYKTVDGKYAKVERKCVVRDGIASVLRRCRVYELKKEFSM